MLMADLEKLGVMTVNERLKAWRKAYGFKQETLAEALGVARPTYTGYEKDNPIPESIIKALRTRGFDPDLDEPEVIRPRASRRQILFVINVLASPNVSDDERQSAKLELLAALGMSQ